MFRIDVLKFCDCCGFGWIFLLKQRWRAYKVTLSSLQPPTVSVWQKTITTSALAARLTKYWPCLPSGPPDQAVPWSPVCPRRQATRSFTLDGFGIGCYFWHCARWNLRPTTFPGNPRAPWEPAMPGGPYKTTRGPLPAGTNRTFSHPVTWGIMWHQRTHRVSNTSRLSRRSSVTFWTLEDKGPSVISDSKTYKDVQMLGILPVVQADP